VKKGIIGIILTIAVILGAGSFSYASDIDGDMADDIEVSGSINLQASAEHQMKLDKVEGTGIDTFYIERPDPEALNSVNASQFGLSALNEDNFDAFQSALDYCKANPNTKLNIEKGVYYFRKDATLKLKGLENVLIEGDGAEFIFETQKQFSISGCDGLELHNLIIDWNWEEDRIASLVRVQNKKDKSFEIVFLELDDVDENIRISSFQQYDSVGYSAGNYGAYRCFVPDEVPGSIESVEKVDRNVLRINFTSKFTTSFHNEDVYILRHYIYGGQVFSVNGGSKNVTFDNIRIYGTAGMGYVIGDKSNHFQIINSYIGLRPGAEDKTRMSATVDGIHILNTDGYFRIDNCDFSFTGDDIINVHDDMLRVLTVNSSTEVYGYLTGGFAEKGDRISIYNPLINKIDFETTIETITRKGDTATLKLKDEIPEEVGEGYLIYRSSSSTHNYAITNNYIHECRGRAALLNGSNALFENNRVYRTSPGCIEVTQGISERENKTWYEGIGSTGVVINNNIFEECCFGNGSQVIYVGHDRVGNNTIISDVYITNNTFEACYGVPLIAENVSKVYIRNNYISDSGEFVIGDNTSEIEISNDNKFVRPSDTCLHTDTMQVGARAPGCYEYGSTGRTYCKQCRTIIDSNYIGIRYLEHEGYKVTRIDVAPSCTESGLASTVCSLCKTVVESNITVDPTGHSFVAVKSGAAGATSSSHKCSGCGKTEVHDSKGAGGICSVCGYGKAVKVDSMSLELNSNKVNSIGINLYIAAPVGTLLYVDGKKTEPVKTEDGLYKIQYKCAPKELADKHTLTATDNTNISLNINSSSKYVYSGDIYCRSVLSSKSDYSEKLINICSSLIDYNEQARNYFGYNSAGLVTADLATRFPSSDYSMKTTGNLPNGTAYQGSSLILGDELILRHYFSGDSRRYVYACTNKDTKAQSEYSVEAVDSADVFYVDIAVDYSNINHMYEFKVANRNNSYTLKYGVLTYCQKAESQSCDNSLTNLCKAMYNFSTAVKNY